MLGSLENMTITGYTDEGFSTPAGAPYRLMINPESIKWNRKINYTDQPVMGSSAPSQKYESTPQSDLSFKIVIDCTGVVDITRIDMATEISELEKIIYKFNGTEHRPNFVKIQWGLSMIFKGVLTAMDTSYTLFRPDGSALRATIDLSFGEYTSPSIVQQQEKKQSPDVTHLVDVVEGDMLPQLCQKIWKDSSHYIKVAEFNKLNKFRQLSGGKQLVFPPIIQPN